MFRPNSMHILTITIESFSIGRIDPQSISPIFENEKFDVTGCQPLSMSGGSIMVKQELTKLWRQLLMKGASFGGRSQMRPPRPQRRRLWTQTLLEWEELGGAFLSGGPKTTSEATTFKEARFFLGEGKFHSLDMRLDQTFLFHKLKLFHFSQVSHLCLFTFCGKSGLW